MPVDEPVFVRSLPARGAWIEIARRANIRCGAESLPARGAWIEILFDSWRVTAHTGRSPRGERGLKFEWSV